MNRKRFLLVTALLFLLALVVFFPLSAVVSLSGITGKLFAARDVEGTVWSGTLRGVSIDGIPMGDFKTAVPPFAFLKGRLEIQLEGLDDSAKRARLLSSFSAYGIDTLNVQIVAPAAFAPLPVESLTLTNVAAEIRGTKCVIAAGRIEAVVDGSIAGLPERLTLQGVPRCDGDVILAPLVSSTGQEQLRLRLSPDGQYAFQLIVKPADQAAADKLRGVGFAEQASGFILGATGRF